jgi:hypothetical protein
MGTVEGEEEFSFTEFLLGSAGRTSFVAARPLAGHIAVRFLCCEKIFSDCHAMKLFRHSRVISLKLYETWL